MDQKSAGTSTGSGPNAAAGEDAFALAPRTRPLAAATNRAASVPDAALLIVVHLAADPSETPIFWIGYWNRPGGGGGIRTHGRVPPSAVFKTARFDRSRTPPAPESMHLGGRSGWSSDLLRPRGHRRQRRQ